MLLAIAATLGVVAWRALQLPSPPPATQPSGLGDPAPVFSLTATGPAPVVALGDLLAGGRAGVLVFYRGDW